MHLFQIMQIPSFGLLHPLVQVPTHREVVSIDLTTMSKGGLQMHGMTACSTSIIGFLPHTEVILQGIALTITTPDGGAQSQGGQYPREGGGAPRLMKIQQSTLLRVLTLTLQLCNRHGITIRSHDHWSNENASNQNSDFSSQEWHEEHHHRQR